MDTPIADLGGLNIGQSKDTGDSSIGAAGSASQEAIKTRKQRSDKGGARGTRGGNAGAIAVQLSEEQFRKLYSPELWGKILSSPADGLAAISGDKTWEVSENERQTLGEAGSIAASCFAVTDPKYLALTMLGIALIDVYGMRFAKLYADKKAEAKKHSPEKEIK